MNPSPPAAVVFLLGIAASAWVWTHIFRRWHRGQALLEPRRQRPVPWRAGELLLVVVAYVALESLVLGLAVNLFGLELPEPAPRPVEAAQPAPELGRLEPQPADEADQAEAAAKTDRLDSPTLLHPVARLLLDPTPGRILLCLLAAVVVAPVVEEFLFRGLLQGWLKRQERLWRRRRSALAGWPPGTISIGITALVFGAVHFRRPSDQPVDVFIGLLWVTLVQRVALLAVAVAMVRSLRGATPRDLGVPQLESSRDAAAGASWSGDVRLGLLTFAALLLPAFGLQLLLVSVVEPQNVAPDPLPLILFGLITGYVYDRTRRIVPTIVAHMCFNAFALLMLALSVWFPAPPG